MKILFVTNATLTCGVAEFGRQHVEALRALGHEVDEWFPSYEYKEWPILGNYAVAHVNYHPGTLGHLRPPADYSLCLLSAFLHEPSSDFSFGKLDIAFQAESEPRAAWRRQLFMPCPDYESRAYKPGAGWVAGLSSLRLAGVDWVKPVTDKLGVVFDWGQEKRVEGNWLPIENEIDRLNRCDFLIYWYPGANAGQSAGLMTGVAAQRPLLLNRNRMFDSVRDYGDELYFADDLERGIKLVIHDLKRRVARVPRRLKKDRGWANAAMMMARTWEGMLWQRGLARE